MLILLRIKESVIKNTVANIFGIFAYELERLLATAIRYEFDLPTCIQEPLVTGRRGYL